jgi:hypothetical protein
MVQFTDRSPYYNNILHLKPQVLNKILDQVVAILFNIFSRRVEPLVDTISWIFRCDDVKLINIS